MERTTGFEPATLTLATCWSASTPLLHMRSRAAPSTRTSTAWCSVRAVVERSTTRPAAHEELRAYVMSATVHEWWYTDTRLNREPAARQASPPSSQWRGSERIGARYPR